jgi:transaldolase/glucose-6-phosphate isomerase
MEVVTQELEDEGVKAFADAFAQLLKTIDERRTSAVSSLGPIAGPVTKRIAQLEADASRAFRRMITLWQGSRSQPSHKTDGLDELP